MAVAKEAAAAIMRNHKQFKVAVIAKPWLNYFFEAILRGIWHPPGVVVGNKLVSQGTVPDKNSMEKVVLCQP